MKIGAIIPTRGNRPILLDQCKRYLNRQTRPFDEILLVDYPQTRFPYDLTERYRTGLEVLQDRCDLIFFIEDDDYYPANYAECMVSEWEGAGRPDLFGIGETYFYHPELRRAWYKLHPQDGPCAFQMCIRSEAVQKIDWSLVNDLFIDAGLWRQLIDCETSFLRGRPLAIGIKHGRGSCGASGHNEKFYRDREAEVGSDVDSDEWTIEDKDGSWLREMIGNDALWYEGFAKHKGII